MYSCPHCDTLAPMSTKVTKHTRADTEVPCRSVYRLPMGEWNSLKDDKSTLGYTANLGSLPYWHFRSHGRDFGLSGLREIYSAPLTPKGMKEVLDTFGPWDLQGLGEVGSRSLFRSGIKVDFALWFWPAIKIQRAYALYLALRRGDDFDWEEHSSVGSLPHLRLLSFPEKLRLSLASEPCELWLSLDEPIFSEGGDWRDSFTARRCAKSLLAQMVDEGLEGVRLGFGYSSEMDSFRTDTGESGPIGLAAACWLVLRDLSANLKGLRFCASCRTKIPSSARGDAMVCPGSRKCQQAYYRARKAAASHG